MLRLGALDVPDGAFVVMAIVNRTPVGLLVAGEVRAADDAEHLSALVDDGHGVDALPDQQLGDLLERRVGVHGQHLSRHGVAHGPHGVLLSIGRRCAGRARGGDGDLRAVLLLTVRPHGRCVSPRSVGPGRCP